MIGLNELTLPGFNIEVVKKFARHGLNAIRMGKLGYAIVIAAKTS